MDMNTMGMSGGTGMSRIWSLVFGTAMLLLGIVAIILSSITTTATIVLLGIVLAVRGIIDALRAFGPYRREGFWWHLFGGVLSLIVGILILSRPGATAATITYLIALFLITMGIFKIIAAPVEHESNWGWVMLSGLITLFFGIWVISVWPAISIFLIGLFIGIEIFVQGIVMIAQTFTRRQHYEKPAGEAFAH